MSENNGRATLASDISVPEEVVELKYLKAKDGSPVKVKVYPVSPLMAGRAGLALPGVTPKTGLEGSTDTAMREVMDRQNLTLMLDLAAPIIEDCTALSGAGGAEIKPAFYFTTMVPGSIPGRVLHAEDLSLLVATAMKLAGYGVEVAESVSFRGRKRGGSSVGA